MSDPRPLCVVLLDIDGTLLTGPADAPSAGLFAMNRAAKIMTGVDDLGDPAQFAGRTDPQIARMLLSSAGNQDPSDQLVDKLVNLYLEGLALRVQTVPYQVLGEPKTAVEQLRAMGAVVSLGTGNVVAGAKIKLENSGLANLFDFSLGGYGDDGVTRALLLEVGAGRCDPTGELPVVIVGDTPRDIGAAKEISAYSIGVPYRNNTQSVLREAGADDTVDAVSTDLVDSIKRLLSS